MIFITPGNAYRRVQVHSASQIARIDRTELGDAAQAGEVQRGGILNNQYALLVEASLGGFKTKTTIQTRAAYTVVGIEPVSCLGLTRIASRGLRDRGHMRQLKEF